MTKMLSIDQAANASGWAYWEDHELKAWGIINPKPKTLRGGERLYSLQSQFEELIEKYKPTELVIEDPVGGAEDKKGPENNWKTMQVLCHVQSILLVLAVKYNLSLDIVSPSSWQHTCNIHARDRDARKNGARSFVMARFKLSEEQVAQDVCDAICIGFHHLTYKELEECAF